MYELSSMTFGQTSNTSVTNFTANIVAHYSHLTTYAWKKVTILVGHFQKIDLFYDW